MFTTMFTDSADEIACYSYRLIFNMFT